MSEVTEARNLPSMDRLSIIAATIFLAYTLVRYVEIPATQLAMQLPGVYIEINFNTTTLVALLVAGLTASGADWLIRDHPALGNRSTIQNWILPALTALVIGLPLSQMPLGLSWWVGFIVAVGVLMLVLIAEYIVVDPSDIRQPLARIVLIAISFALYLALIVFLRSAGFRLYIILPTLTVAAALVSLRTLNLRLHGYWAFEEAGIVALIIAQLAGAIYYWPISPISYGLLILGPAYASTSLLTNMSEGIPLRQAIVEPAIILLIIFGIALWIR